MLVIPNTTTTATDQTAGAAVFPSTDSGALTPFAAGYLFVANNSAQFSIRKGSAPPGDWTPYALVSPTLIPLSTDRGGRKTPDFIYGVKAIDAVAGTHAQVFGGLFQPGEAGFIPSTQFAGTVMAGGGFVPVVPDVTRGSTVLTWPGGSVSSNVNVVTHGLGFAPGAIALTPSGTAAGVNQPTVGIAFLLTPTTFSCIAETTDGSSPGAGGTQTFFWIAA